MVNQGYFLFLFDVMRRDGATMEQSLTITAFSRGISKLSYGVLVVVILGSR